MMRRATVLLTLVATIAMLAGTGNSSAAQQPPDFHMVACPEGVFPEDVYVFCGFVVVPENRARPHGRQIRVMAAYVHATSDDPAPDPIVFVSGGPSFGAISDFSLGLYLAGAEFAEDHDLVLVDTRGTGFSTPRLGCPELDEAEVGAFYSEPYANAQAVPIAGEAIRACRERLVGEGIHPASYNTTESAADLDALRQALGVRRWNLLAASADGMLGLTYMRMFPHGIRSAIIDSGTSNTVLWGLDYDRGTLEMVETAFAGCRANLACNQKYPGIRQKFYRMVRQLNETPFMLTIEDFDPEPVTIPIDGAGLMWDTASMVFPGNAFEPESIHAGLEILWSVLHGGLEENYRALIGTGPVENAHTDDFLAQGKSMSYLCRDFVGFVTWKDRVKAARDIPAYRHRYLDRGFDLANGWWYPFSPAGCQFWKAGVADPVVHKPVSSRIPTLVLAGEYDGALPAYMVRQMLPTLKRSTYVEMPMSHHLQLASYNNSQECSRRLASAFLARPKATVDTSCVDELPRFDYTPPSPETSSRASTGTPPLRWRGVPWDRPELIRSRAW